MNRMTKQKSEVALYSLSSWKFSCFSFYANCALCKSMGQAVVASLRPAKPGKLHESLLSGTAARAAARAAAPEAELYYDNKLFFDWFRWHE